MIIRAQNLPADHQVWLVQFASAADPPKAISIAQALTTGAIFESASAVPPRRPNRCQPIRDDGGESIAWEAASDEAWGLIED